MVWYRFGEFELDLGTFVLRRRNCVQPLQPKIFDLLRYLVEHRDTVVTKAELLREVWDDRYVNENAVAWSVSHIRRTLGQQGGRYPIETVARRGYRFTADVTQGDSSLPPPDASGTAVAASPAVQARAVSSLVGRAHVMTELGQLARDAAHSRGSLNVITGAAGIGKTRCAEELVSVARATGLQVFWGRCPQDPGLPTLWPIEAALRGAAGERSELAAKVNQVIVGAGGDFSSDAGQYSAARFWLAEQVAQLLREESVSRPTLLILDDLHWADAGTLDLLGLIASELHDLPLCVVATLCDGEVEPGGMRDQSLRRMLRHARTIPLVAFDADEVADLTQSICGQRPSDALAEAIRRAAGGVPLFVQEIARSLLREHGADGLARQAPEAIRPPAMARDLLHQRVQRLPASTVDVLSNAAAIGETFDLSLLVALVELEPETLLERLEPALLEGQLQSDAPHVYRFVHSLLRSVLYDDLAVTKRIAIHRKLGTLLRAWPEDERRDADVARHFYLSLPAGDHLLVMQLARAAGDAAQRAFAHETAAVQYGWALEAQIFGGSSADPRERAELLLALATAQRLSGRTRDALETTSRLLELAQQQRMSEVVVRATRLRRPTVAMAMIPDKLARAALEAVIAQEPAVAVSTQVSALAQLACTPPNTYDLSLSKRLTARALELARDLPDSEPRFEAMRARLFSLSGPDDIQEVLQVADDMLSVVATGPGTWGAGDARMARYAAFLLSGRIADADAVLGAMVAAVGDRYWPEATFFCQRLAVQRRFLDGHFEEADQRWKVVHGRAVRAGVSYADMFYNTHNYNLRLEREGPKAVLSPSLVSTPVATQTPYTRAGMARVAAEAGEHELARGLLSAFSDPHALPRDGHYLYLLANLAGCASSIGDKPRCEQLFALLEPYADLNTPSQMGYYLGSVAHFLAQLAVALGRDAHASAFFERALERNQAMGYRAGVVRTLLAHGQQEMRLGHQRAAHGLLTRARAEAHALGMKAALAACDAALRAS